MFPDLEWRAMQSGHLNRSAYAAEEQKLVIEFTNGATYVWHDVPQTTYDSLCQSGSPGGYFHAKIRDQYSSTQLKTGTTQSGKESKRRRY